MNDLYFKLEVEPKEKYEKAKKDCLDAVKSIDKAMKSLNELTPPQRDELLKELLLIGEGKQCLNCMNQHYGMR